ncbi:MAG: hypothetical protein QM486_02000 [Flavobacteriaceae bacterium]
MKFNNHKRVKNTKQFYNTLLIISLAIFVFIAITPIHNTRFNMVKYIFLGFAFLIVILAVLGNGYFEYDSTGMVVIIKNDGIYKKEMAPLAIKTIEFPKKKLKDFKIKNYLVYRALNIYLHSKDKGTIKKHFNITNLSKKRAKHLKQSLKKVIRENS